MIGEVKKDCFAYREPYIKGKGACSALNALYCADENETKECPFYKKCKKTVKESED